MNWSYMALTFLLIFLIIYVVISKNNLYFGYDKSPWANNIRVLGLLFAISLVLLSFACQVGEKSNKLLGPFLCLNFVFLFLWFASLTYAVNFTFVCVASWIIFVITLTLIILLGNTNEKSLCFVGLPFLFISLLILSVSHDIAGSNPERPNNILY